MFNSELLQFYFQPDTAVEWAQSRFGLRAGGAEDGRTPSADDELPSKEASTFHAAAANSNRGDGPSARDCFQQRSDPYLVLSLVLLCLSRLFVGALSHFVFTPSFKPHVSLPQSEASISDLPGTLSSAKGFLLAGSVCTCSVVSRLRRLIGCQECCCKRKFDQLLSRKVRVEPLMVGRWLITTRDAC